VILTCKIELLGISYS